MKKSQKILVLLIILIIVIIIILLFCLNNIYNTRENINEASNININNTLENVYIDRSEDIKADEIEISKKQIHKLKHITNVADYFTIKSIVSNYISYCGYGQSNELLNLLSKDYIKQYNVTENNVLQKVDIKKIQNENNYYKYSVNEILISEQENNITAYLVSGEYKVNNSSDYIATKVIVLLDTVNKKYEIYPENYLQIKGYNNLSEGSLFNLGDVKISEQSEKFIYITKNDREIANELFNQWQDYIIYNKSKAYNKLNIQYKKNKFNTLQKFENYISTQKYIPIINEYRVYSTQKYTDYICTDQYNNYYIFRQQGGIMSYSVFLDNYTVELDAFKKNYEKASIDDKISIQIGKFKYMLNSKDYNAIYNKLNKTFRQNNFSTISKLEDYLKNKVYEINSIEVSSCTENDGYYMCACTLIDEKNIKNKKKIDIIIKLIDSNNFEISFSM